MIVEFHVPSGLLGAYVNLMVYHEGYSPDHSVERFLPDGSVDLVIDLRDDPKYTYNDDLTVRSRHTGAWFSGIRTGFISISSGRDSSMLVVNFKPFGAFPFVNVPLEEFMDQVVDAESVLGSEIRHLRDALRNAADPAARFRMMEAWLMARYCPPANGFDLTRGATLSILQSPATSTIDRVTRLAGVSNKHLISVFRRYLGITPKQFQRIMRFQAAIQAIENAQEVNWTAIAYDCGFYDQSHFIQEFQRFSGFTPTDYVAARGENLNYVPVA